MSVDHYENFPVASWLCPPELRPAVRAIYWYARTADDLADEGDASARQRHADLLAYRADLRRVARGEPPSSRWAGVFTPLAEVLQRHNLPLKLLEDLLSAFEQDVNVTRYADRPALLDYCRRSANPIGRLLLHLYGVHDELALQRSDAICTALQLINFWQDLSIDLPRGRLYIPLKDCAAAGVDPDDLLAGRDGMAPRVLIASEVAWARQLMASGAPLATDLPSHVARRLGWELRLVVQGGLAIAGRIEAMDYATVTRRPRLRSWHAPLMLWRALRMHAVP
ncbi:MAG: squalene synthase HpnC [Burkholderiales bacterium]|nr:squalene synthase HpnC [Burkholderiales bacterium]